MGFITDIHTHRYNSEITPKWAKMKLFISMSKVNLGTLPSTQNTFSVLFDSVCAVTAWITNCDKSQIATVVSQFVTVAICDGSKHNFSDWYVIWYVMWYLIWCDVMWYGIWYHMMYDIISYDIIWYNAISYDIIWYHLIWCYIIWYHMILYDMTHHAIPYNTLSSHIICLVRGVYVYSFLSQ